MIKTDTIRFFLVVLTLGYLNTTFAQSLKPVETPVSRFMLMVDADMHNLMELDAKTTYALAMQLKNDAALQLMNESFEIMQSMLNDSTNFSIPNVDALKGVVKYSLMGFPIGTLKKAAKNGKNEQYVQVDIMVESPQSSTKTSQVSTELASGEEVSQGVERMKIRPQVRVILKFADANGKTISKYTGKYRHDEKFEVNANTIGMSGFSLTTDIVAEPIPYHYFLTKAIEDLIQQLPK
ncbi:MAG: hypothetical protein ABJ004_07805 [Cyclobacteriaceae bacterium]